MDVEVASVITTVIPVAGLEIVAASILVAALAGGLEPAAVVIFADVVPSSSCSTCCRSYSCWICSLIVPAGFGSCICFSF